jgi:D-lactate dehydrogenase (cytochrome)
LADIQRAAESVGLLFPLSLGAEGSCQIGGNLSTNAGGTQVLRFGNSRDLVLGLEVVLPDGRVLDMLRGLRKDNTGYHLSGLFCGAEGTLGILSAAVLKLFPQPKEVATALVAVPSLDAVIKLLSLARAATGDALTGCEFIPRIALDMVLTHIPGTRDPFPTKYPHYLLLEAQSGSEDGRLTAELEKLLADAADQDLVLDATLAQNPAQAEALWHIRESIPDAQKPEGLSVKHDVSLPIHLVPRFVEQASQLVAEEVPGIRVVAFGHVGDGNVHFNLSQPIDMERAAFARHKERLSALVHDLTMSMSGSFSAEHGIGQLKRDELRRYRSPVELDVMRKIKQALDPAGLMNPGKVL